jgi:hypothetical protein
MHISFCLPTHCPLRHRRAAMPSLSFSAILTHSRCPRPSTDLWPHLASSSSCHRPSSDATQTSWPSSDATSTSGLLARACRREGPADRLQPRHPRHLRPHHAHVPRSGAAQRGAQGRPRPSRRTLTWRGASSSTTSAGASSTSTVRSNRDMEFVFRSVVCVACVCARMLQASCMHGRVRLFESCACSVRRIAAGGVTVAC